MPNEKYGRQAHPTNTLAVPSADETRSRVHAVAFILLDQCKNYKLFKIRIRISVLK